MVTSLYSEPIPVTEITSDWRKFHFPRDPRVITCVNLNLDHARGLKNSLHAVFTRYLCGNHVRCIYGNILKYTVNTGVRCSFWWWGVVVFKFRVWCACISHYSPFLSSRPFLPPCACAFSCSVFIAMDHGCTHTDKYEMLLKVSRRFHDDVTLF